MANLQSKDKSYPNLLASNEEKRTTTYGLEWAKFLTNGENNFIKQDAIKQSREYTQGNHDVSKWSGFEKDKKNKTKQQVKYTTEPVSIHVPLINTIKNEIKEHTFKPTGKSLDPELNEQINDELLDIQTDIEFAPLEQVFTQNTGIPLNNMTQQPGMPQNMKGFEIYKKFGYKHVFISSIEKLTKHTLDKSHWSSEVENLLVDDLVDLNLGIVFIDKDENAFPIVRYVDPQNAVIPYMDNTTDYHDLPWGGVKTKMSLSTLMAKYGDQLTDKQIKELAGQVGANYSTAYQNLNKFTSEYGSSQVNILTYWVRTNEDLVYQEYQRKDGSKKVEKVGFDVQKSSNRNYKSKPVDMVYQGVYVTGTSIMLEWGHMKDQIRPNHKNQAKAIIPLCVKYIPGKTLGTLIMAHVDYIQGYYFEIQREMKNYIPYLLQVEIEGLLDTFKMKEGGDPKQAMITAFQAMKDTRIVPYKSNKHDMGNGQPPLTVAQTQLQIGVIQQQIFAEYDTIKRIVGVSDARLGQEDTKESLPGMAKLSVNRSQKTTQHFYKGHQDIYSEVCQKLSVKIQDYVLENGINYIENIINPFEANALKNNKKFSSTSLGITLKALPTEEEKAKLDSFLQLALQQGQITIDDVLLLSNMEDMNQIELTLAMKIKEYSEAMAQQNQQNQQYQMQMEQQKQQAEQSRISIKAEMEGEYVLKAKEMEIKKIEREYELKALNDKLSDNREAKLQKELMRQASQDESDKTNFSSKSKITLN